MSKIVSYMSWSAIVSPLLIGDDMIVWSNGHWTDCVGTLGQLGASLIVIVVSCGLVMVSSQVLRYCRNVRPTWVKFNSKDTKESEWCSRF